MDNGYVCSPHIHMSGAENPYVILSDLSSARSSALLPPPQFQLPRMVGKLILLPRSFRESQLLMKSINWFSIDGNLLTLIVENSGCGWCLACLCIRALKHFFFGSSTRSAVRQILHPTMEKTRRKMKKMWKKTKIPLHVASGSGGNQHCGQTSTSSTSARPCRGGTSQEAGWSSSRWYPSACAGSGQEKIRLPRSFRGASARLPRILGPKRVQNNISKSQSTSGSGYMYMYMYLCMYMICRCRCRCICIYCILYIVYWVYCILYIVYCIVYIVYCILYMYMYTYM